MEDQAWVLVLQEEYSDPHKMVSQTPCVLSEEPWADPVQDLQGSVVGAWCPLLVPQHPCSSFLVALEPGLTLKRLRVTALVPPGGTVQIQWPGDPVGLLSHQPCFQGIKDLLLLLRWS